MTIAFQTKIFMLFIFALIVNGCAAVKHRTPLPETLSPMAGVPDISKARFWGDEPVPDTKERL